MKEHEKRDNTLMTSGTIWKQILFFAIPLILGNLFQQLYSMVDAIIVGNFVGPNALAAVGSSMTLINLIIGFFIGAAAGSGVVTSQFYGAGNDEGVRKAVHTTLAISIIGGIILSVAGVLIAPWLLRVINTPDEVYDQAKNYLQIFFAGIFFSIIYNMSAGILNAVGNSRKSLHFLIIATLSNIVLDLVFVALLKTGVGGAAVATDISQGISCFFILRYMRKVDASYRVTLKDIRFYDNLAGKIIKIGLPTGIQNIVISLSNVVVQAGINGFGASVMASFAALGNIDGFIILPILSMSMAATTFSGQNYGAGQMDRIKKGTRTSILMACGYAIVAGCVMLIVGPFIIRIFTQDQTVIHYAVFMMRIMYPFYWLLGIFHVAVGTIRGVGKTFQAMVMSLVALCAARILWIWITSKIAHSLLLLIACYPVTWILGAVIAFVYIKWAKWLVPPEADELECL